MGFVLAYKAVLGVHCIGQGSYIIYHIENVAYALWKESDEVIRSRGPAEQVDHMSITV